MRTPGRPCKTFGDMADTTDYEEEVCYVGFVRLDKVRHSFSEKILESMWCSKFILHRLRIKFKINKIKTKTWNIGRAKP